MAEAMPEKASIAEKYSGITSAIKILIMSDRLQEIALTFFRLSCIAFGGPAAHIAMMEDEIVHRRRWMDRQHFLDLVGATNLIPGPNSTEMTMHCGRERGGIAGLFVAGACFIFPAVVLTGILAWAYARYGEVPAVQPFLRGIKPAVLAVILAAVWKLGKSAIKNVELGVLGVLVLVSALLGVNEIVALLGAGLLGMLYFAWRRSGEGGIKQAWPLVLLQATGQGFAQVPTLKVFWTFLKVGSVLYGSGYVLFAYLDAELVTKGWLSQQALIDAVAVGQFTPGPVLSTATFIGWQLGGLSGAAAATLGIFLPSFFFVWILNPLVPKLRKSPWLSGFLDAVNSAAVAVMLAVLIEMGRATLVDWPAWLIAAISAGLVLGPWKVHAMWIVLLGAVLGWILW